MCGPPAQPTLLSASPPAGTVVSFSYGFDQDASPSVVKNNGNVVQIVNNRDTNRTQSFTYDELNRVAYAWSSGNLWGNQFVYDIWANLNKKLACAAGSPCQGKPQGENLDQSAGIKNQFAGFCHDAAGNLNGQSLCPILTYTYDAENRLVTTAGVTYTYDGDGKRVKKSNGKLYWTGTGSDALAETDLAGVIQSEFTFFGGKRIARRDGSGNTVFYYFSDHLGSAGMVTSATGTIVEESDYYPFGGERIITNSDPNQYKFTGKERDAESGLDYFIARHYSSNLGRFLQPDEFSGGPVDAFSSNDPLPESPLPYADITNPQSLNKYTYTYNNPLLYTDPSGHCPQCIGAILGAGVGGAVILYRTFDAYTSGTPLPSNKEISQTLATGAVIGGTLGAIQGGVKPRTLPPLPPPAEPAQGNPGESSGATPEPPKPENPEATDSSSSGQTGTIYVVPGSGTESGNDYVGRHNKPDPAKTRRSSDGRDRTQAEVVDTYDTSDTQQGRVKEQQQIDERGGVKNLDNKRNEIRKTKD